MTIKTKYNIGDTVIVGGESYEILAIHLYESIDTHTERYYIGNKQWITIVKKEKKHERNH